MTQTHKQITQTLEESIRKRKTNYIKLKAKLKIVINTLVIYKYCETRITRMLPL